MENLANDLIVNSKGHCFFCLDKISIKMTPVKLEDVSMAERYSTSSLHSLYGLSQYLKMDLTKVLNQKGSISQSLLSKVEQSRLKVELCEDCAKLSDSVSHLYKHLEKIRMEIDLKLSHIQDKLSNADEMRRTKELRRLGEDEGLMEVLEVLRAETMEKCSNRFSALAPRVSLKKLTRKDIKANLRIGNAAKQFSNTMTDIELGIQSNNPVKMENQNDESALVWNDGNDFLDGLGGSSDDESIQSGSKITKQSVIQEPADGVSSDSFNTSNVSVPSKSKRRVGKQEYIFNPQTGKFKCSLCSKEFGRSGFYYHYANVHLKIRYKCNLCEKLFSHRHHYKRHLRSVHVGNRFKCLACDMQFAKKLT